MIKNIIKISVALIAVFLVIFIAASVFIAFNGKNIVVAQIEKNLGVKASLESISLSLPFSVNLTKLEIGDLFKADKISVSPNLFSLFPGKIVLGNLTLVNPEINLVQEQDGRLNLPQFKQGGAPPEVIITGLVVQNGKLIFTDKKIDPNGFKTILSDVNVRVSKVMLPLASLSANFDLSTQVLTAQSRKIGQILLKGWIDFTRKNMDANLQIKDLDPVYFTPYFGDFISEKKLLSGKLNLSSIFKAQNNDLGINTDFRLFGLVYAPQVPPEDGEAVEIDLKKKALDFFTDSKGNLDFKFKLKTKFDKPDITAEQLKKAMLSAAAGNILNQNPADIYEKVMDIGKQFEQMFKKKKD
jgi:hypothetical protein